MDSRELPLNEVYKEIATELGMEAAQTVYQMFHGQQISFPQRFYKPEGVRQRIMKEFNGTNVRELAKKYDYSEKTIRRIVKDHPLKGER